MIWRGIARVSGQQAAVSSVVGGSVNKSQELEAGLSEVSLESL